MASNTMATWNRRKRNHKNQGRKRKNGEARTLTPSARFVRRVRSSPDKPATKTLATATKAKSARKEGAREEARRLIQFCQSTDRRYNPAVP